MYLINGSPNVCDDLTAVGLELTAIKAKTDNLPSDPADQSLLLAELENVDHHFHNIERWFGKKAVPVAGVNEMDNVLTPFQIDSGNNAYGTGICVIGSGDTPVLAGKTKFDIHKILIVNTERANEPYKLRITWGATEAAGVAAGNYSTTMIYPSTTLRQTPQEIKAPQLAAGTKLWVNCWCGANTGTIDLFVGLHEYD